MSRMFKHVCMYVCVRMYVKYVFMHEGAGSLIKHYLLVQCS